MFCLVPQGASFPKLQVLNLGVGDSISLEGSVQAIFNSCPNLRSFLCATSYTNVSLFGTVTTTYRNLPQTPHPFLEVLDLSGWSLLSDEHIAKFAKAFPSLKVIYAVNCQVTPTDGSSIYCDMCLHM
jgi:hypothetical protein